MIDPLSFTEQIRRQTIYLAAITISLALSLWLVLGQEIINQDAVLYFNAIFGEQESLLRINNWVFYPKLIYWLSSLTGLDLEASAHLINALLDALLVVAFLRAAEELGAKPPILVWAALIILTLPYLNDNRAEIIRGHGYWAFILLAFTYYVRLYRAFTWQRLLAWLALMAIATLFRIEALVLAIFLPLGFLLNDQILPARRLANLARCYLPLGIALLLILGSYYLLGGFENRLLEVAGAFNQLTDSLTRIVPAKSLLLRQHVFPLFSASDATTSIYIIALTMIMLDFVQAMTLFYLGVWVAGKYLPATGLAPEAKPIIATWFAVNVIVLVPYMLHYFVMVSRYTLLLAMLLLIVVAFSLAEVRRKSIEKPSRTNQSLYGLALLLITGLFLDSVIESPSSKTYVSEAGRWLKQNAPECAVIATDHQRDRLRYYANTNRDGLGCMTFLDLEKRDNRSSPYQWMILEVDNSRLVHPRHLKGHKRLRVREFLNEKKDGYFLYQIEN